MWLFVCLEGGFRISVFGGKGLTQRHGGTEGKILQTRVQNWEEGGMKKGEQAMSVRGKKLLADDRGIIEAARRGGVAEGGEFGPRVCQIGELTSKVEKFDLKTRDLDFGRRRPNGGAWRAEGESCARCAESGGGRRLSPGGYNRGDNPGGESASGSADDECP